MPRDLPSGTVTLLFSDVEGSTRLLHERGTEGYGQALSEHRRLLREAFDRHGGVEVDTQGDAFFVAFPSAPGAVAAALAAQQSLETGPIRVRIGIHTGTPGLTEEGYVGEDVHLGARIGAAGHGGQVLISQATRDLVEVEVTELGEHRLKDFDEPVPIFQLGSERFPPLKTISNTNLPRPASSFLGRAGEVAEVAALVRGGARLVTLSGPGGSGKTRLAIEAAAQLVGELKAGVFWVGLADIRDPALVTETIARELGAKDGLAAWIGERELLLLLDNLEQVIDAAPQLAALVEACPNLVFLVTSRELLRVRGEVEYPVPPLADPDAVALFTARAGVESDDAVAELCRRLDNLPLALELAAARAAVLSPAQILERLSQRLDLLKGGRDADPRQQTLRTTIAWSYDLLDAEERGLSARLAVFRGGCTLEAAEAIAAADLDILQSLVDKSLVRHTGERFWMLESIREYAAEQLDDPQPLDAHAAYFVALAEEAFPHLDADATAWFDRLEAEHDNLRAALDRLEELGDTTRALQLAGALHRFWYRRGHFAEGRSRLERLLAADADHSPALARAVVGAAVLALNTGDLDTARRRADEALELHRGLGDDWGLAYSIFLAGTTAVDSGDPVEGARLLEDSIERLRTLGDDYFARLAVVNLAYARQLLGEYERASELLEKALEQAEEAGDEVQQAQALGQLATGARRAGRFDEALALLARSLPIWVRADDPAMIARDLRRLARVLAHLERPSEAARVLAASEELRETIGHMESWIAAENAEILEIVHSQLDGAAFERAWSEGRKLSVDDALGLARPEREQA